jgi:antitoxin ParD1/3/4
MATMNVSLPDQMKAWVEAQVKSGKYANASDYMRDLIRRDQDARERREALIAALVEGEASGISDRSIEEILRDARKRAKAAAADG